MNTPANKSLERIQWQYCTFKQAKELFDLGINANSNMKWLLIKHGNGRHTYKIEETSIADLLFKRFKEDSINAEVDIYPAYNVAELGLLCTGTIIGSSFWLRNFHKNNIQLLEGNTKTDFSGKTEAEARANLLIHLVRNKKLDIEDINNTLK